VKYNTHYSKLLKKLRKEELHDLNLEHLYDNIFGTPYLISNEDLQEKYGINIKKENLLNKANQLIMNNFNGLTKKERRIIKLYIKGIKVKSITKKLNLSKSYIYKILKLISKKLKLKMEE